MATVLQHRGAVMIPRDEYEREAEALASMIRLASAFFDKRIARLDQFDGDPDLETCRTEDDFTPMPDEIDFGPGCHISDPAELDDEPEDDDPGGGNVEDEPHDPQGDYDYPGLIPGGGSGV